MIEDESVERGPRERSPEDGGEGDSLERCVAEMGGGEGRADGGQGGAVMEDKEGGEELHAGTEGNTPEEEHDGPELPLKQQPGKEELTGLCVVVAVRQRRRRIRHHHQAPPTAITVVRSREHCDARKVHKRASTSLLFCRTGTYAVAVTNLSPEMKQTH